MREEVTEDVKGMEEDDWSFGLLIVLKVYVRYVYVLISGFSISFSIYHKNE